MARSDDEIGLRQLWRLAGMSSAQRIELIAEGMPLIVKSAQGLVNASNSLGGSNREAEILLGIAAEEAAKVLMLVDVVRCPEKHASRYLPRLLRAWYSHSARLLYAKSCTWKPTNLADLREYVNESRKSHHLDGPNHVDFIMPNWDIYDRESTLYTDLTYDGEGTLSWNDPEIGAFGGLRSIPSYALDTVHALFQTGALTFDGLKIIADLWQQHPFDTDQPWELDRRLRGATYRRLVASCLIKPTFSADDQRAFFSAWQMPMYAFDFRLVDVDINELRRIQESTPYE